MWNNVAQQWQNPSVKRLGLAVIVSMLLHAIIANGLHISLPALKQDYHPLEARIQMPKAVVKEAESKPNQPLAPAKAQPVKKTKPIKPKPIKHEKPQPQKEIVPEAILPSNEQAIVHAEPEPPPALQEPVTAVDSTLPETVAIPENGQPSENPEQALDAGLVINPNAYKYAETSFNVSTKIDGPTEGVASIIYDVNDSSQYKINWITKPKGLAALVIGELKQTSEGSLMATGLQPNKYTYEYGNKPDKSRIASFDWTTKKVNISNANGAISENLTEGTQDLISFMYQFMYVAPLQTMQISITNGKKVAVYDYSFEGEEDLENALGYVKTVHLKHSGENDEEKTEIWLALDHQYLPVKIRKTEKNGKVYELTATNINTTRPATP
jgi:Protein of unknown function (DUF3108)